MGTCLKYSIDLPQQGRERNHLKSALFPDQGDERVGLVHQLTPISGLPTVCHALFTDVMFPGHLLLCSVSITVSVQNPHCLDTLSRLRRKNASQGHRELDLAPSLPPTSSVSPGKWVNLPGLLSLLWGLLRASLPLPVPLWVLLHLDLVTALQGRTIWSCPGNCTLGGKSGTFH